MPRPARPRSWNAISSNRPAGTPRSADGAKQLSRKRAERSPAVPRRLRAAAETGRGDRLEQRDEAAPARLVVRVPPRNGEPATVLGDESLVDHLVEAELRVDDAVA